MILIHSHDDKSSESKAANLLAKLATVHDNDIEKSNLVLLEIFPSANCFGQKTKEIDLVVFYADYRRADKFFKTKAGNPVQSFCVTIELKGHSPEDVIFDGNNCSVMYNGKKHDVTGQSERQKISLKNYIQKQLQKHRAPWIANLIWLNRVSERSLPASISNIISMDLTWDTFIEKCALLHGVPNSSQRIATFSNRHYLAQITQIFSKRLQASKIDRKKMEAITTSILDRQQYKDKLGQQLLIFRGRGGTGKTVRLIQMAFQAYNENGLRVLILTYNKALVADISRTLNLLGTKEGVGQRSISIKSIYSFVYQWLLSLEVFKREDGDFLVNYEKYKLDTIEMMKIGAITKDDISNALIKDSFSLEWDLIMIDESQDWPASERDLLYSIYGPNKFVIADGVDQLVRGMEITDWRQGANRSVSQIVPLHKSLRLKASLCQAVTHFAEQLEVPNWKLEPLPETHGGKVVVFSGDPFAKDFYAKLTNTAKEDGNEPIDILLCVPPSWVKNKDGRKSSLIADKLRSWDLDVWDAVDPENRDTFATSLDQYRVVQYESCRGLEGWVVICLALDEFYEHKLKNAEISEEARANLYFDEKESAIAYAKKWLMIPMTRAIDTLVIHVNDEDSFVGKSLRELSDRYPHDVTWVKLSDE